MKFPIAKTANAKKATGQPGSRARLVDVLPTLCELFDIGVDLEQLKGKVHVPAVLFYPGVLDGAALHLARVTAVAG